LRQAADYEFRPVRLEDCEYLAKNMRAADVQECIATSGSPIDSNGLSEAVHASPLSVAVWFRGGLLCIGGAARRSLLSDTGTPWMLGTHELDRHGRLFMLHGQRCVDTLLEHFGRLENYVDARNHKSIRWLRRMGFEIHDPLPYGNAGLPFHRFTA
jgi:hypothetical protein